MAILTFPIEANSESWGFRENTQVFSSPIDGVEQVATLSGGKWHASLVFTNVVGARMRSLRAFLMLLRGQAGKFYLSPSNYVPGGDVLLSSAGIVSGANQTGSTLNTSGWTPSILLFRAGDFVEINEELKVLTQDCSSDATGAAVLSFQPELRDSPADALALVCDAPRCVMKLEDDDQVSWAMSLEEVYSLSIACKEVF